MTQIQTLSLTTQLTCGGEQGHLPIHNLKCLIRVLSPFDSQGPWIPCLKQRLVVHRLCILIVASNIRIIHQWRSLQPRHNISMTGVALATTTTPLVTMSEATMRVSKEMKELTTLRNGDETYFETRLTKCLIKGKGDKAAKGTYY